MKQIILKTAIIVTGVIGFYSCQKKDTIAAPVIFINPVVNNVNTLNKHWTKLQVLPEKEFFFGEYTTWWFGGYNFLMGINDNVFAVSMHGGVWRFEKQINSWVKRGSFPVMMTSVPVVFGVNGKGYSIGEGQCWQYDPVLNQWARKTDPPKDVMDALVIGDKVYMRNSNNQLLVYNPSSDSYIQKNNFPINNLLGKFVVNGAGYYISENGKCWKYDPIADTWQQKASLTLSAPVIHSSSFSLNNYGYIIGDLNHLAYNESKPMKVWRYDAPRDQWSKSEDYPGLGAYDIGTVSLNGFVYVGLGLNNADFNVIDFWSFKE